MRADGVSPRRSLLLALLAIAAGGACGPSRSGGDDDDDVRPIDARPPPPVDAPIDAPPDARVSTTALPPDCLAAAERGLVWLTNQQHADGSWGGQYRYAGTGFAVLKLETYASELGQSPFDPFFVYDARVRWGLDYLFRQAAVVPISPQLAGNPDGNGNGTGIRLGNTDGIYDHAIALMAIVAGSDPDRVVTTAGSPVQGLTFRAVVEDAVDYLAMAQSDGTMSSPEYCGRGGWWYAPISSAGQGSGDNSLTQWVTLALEYARHPLYHYEIPTPPWVLTELRDWIACIQNHSGGPEDGGSGYDSPALWVNAYKTGALVQQFAFLAVAPDSPPVEAALAYLQRVWTDQTGAGWRSPLVSDYLTMYAIMKGMESTAITDLGGIDWYREFCDQLEAEQRPDGSWRHTRFDPETDSQPVLSTVWALLVLERAAPPPEIIP